MPKTKVQTYNDGALQVFSVSNIAPNGKAPRLALEPKGFLRYDERTVGLNRFTQFMQNDIEISMVVRCPRRDAVSTQDVVVPRDGQQYQIIQIQYPKDVLPPSMDLTLHRMEGNYATT